MSAVIGMSRERMTVRIALGWMVAVVFLVARPLPADPPAQEKPVAEPAGEKSSAEKPMAEKPAAQQTAAEPPAGGEDETAADDAMPETISGPRDLLRLYGVDASHFQRLTDGVAWQAGEDELLFRIMFRLRQFRLMDIETWARPLASMAELAATPDALRGEFFQLRGRVIGVEACEPLPEVVERFELKTYYRCEFLLGEKRQPAVVFTEIVPEAWKRGSPLDERAGALGMFLKRAGEDPQQPTPVFVARRVAWYPETVLGDLGMDYGLFDDLKPEEPEDADSQGESSSRRRRNLSAMRLTAQTRECFYQMLAVVNRAKPGTLIAKAKEALKKEGREHFSVVPLFNEPEKQRGRLVVLSGTVRQAIPVRVSEEDIQARFGIKEYYQMFLFTDDSQGNPLVCCVPRLPKGMPTGEDPSYAEYVTVAGFFFNTWAYRNRESNPSSGEVHWQLAPLLIGQEPIWHPQPARPPDSIAETIFVVFAVVVLIVVVVALWIAHRGDKEFREKILAKQLSLDTDISLGEGGRKEDGSESGPSA